MYETLSDIEVIMLSNYVIVVSYDDCGIIVILDSKAIFLFIIHNHIVNKILTQIYKCSRLTLKD